jgi:osmoprotectant transport system permease protein
VLDGVRDYLRDEHGILVVSSLGFENTYALAMRGSQARELGVSTITELARVSPNLEIGGDYEFFARAEWKALEETYRLRFRKQRSMDAALMYQAVQAGEVDVISAYSTDGRIGAYSLALLADDRSVIPPYDAIVLARPGLAAERPEVVGAIAKLERRIDEARMQAMNHEVDERGRTPADVARGFLGALRDGS